MRSVFVNSAFSRYDLGRHAWGGGLGLPKLRLGQQSVFALEDYIQKINNVADKETRDVLKAKYKECEDADGTAQIVCYAALANEVYKASKDDATTPKPATVVAPAETSSFPIIPVALAVLGAGALIYFLAVRGKK